jgi:RimJ/RimL family protein N-acetyltransferase
MRPPDQMMSGKARTASVPETISTARLRLAKWRSADAVLLGPILEVNAVHLADWIPPAVALPAPLPELVHRLDGYAADFDEDRCWRYAIWSADQPELLGEVSLFPRSSVGRTQLSAADRVEIGYWLRADVTGRGFATEAAEAMIDVAGNLPAIDSVEIRCDARNTASAAVPQRLGFTLAAPVTIGSHDMVWIVRLKETGR